MPPNIRCIIIDFANTLCSELYFGTLGAGFQALVSKEIFGEANNKRWSTPWCCGRLSSEDIAAHLAGLTGIAPERILVALAESCANMHFNPAIWRFAQMQRALGRRTVLATVNMDIFTQVVVPAHGLDRIFDVVVNSSDYGTDDKNALCEIALAQLDGCTFANSLLIDDSAAAIAAFRVAGGMAYQYTNDAAFVACASCREP